MLYKGYLKERYPRLIISELSTVINELTNDQCELEQTIVKKVLEHMYDENENRVVIQSTENLKYYSEFIKVILEFQLAEHEKYLPNFNILFT